MHSYQYFFLEFYRQLLNARIIIAVEHDALHMQASYVPSAPHKSRYRLFHVAHHTLVMVENGIEGIQIPVVHAPSQEWDSTIGDNTWPLPVLSQR